MNLAENRSARSHAHGRRHLKDCIASEADSYDYPDVMIEESSEGVSIVFDAPHSAGSVADRINFPLSKSQFWSMIQELDARLIESLEVIDLPHIECESRSRDALVVALAEQFFATEYEVLPAIGGGWVSCDDLIQLIVAGRSPGWNAISELRTSST